MERALRRASGGPKRWPMLNMVRHCFVASGAGACMMGGRAMRERLAFWPGGISGLLLLA